MANPHNLTMASGRLARDVTFKENADGSATVFATLMAPDNYKTQGEYKAQALSFQKFLTKDSKQRKYFETWGKLGFEATIVGHRQSQSFEKDGETVYREVTIMDDVDFSTNNANAKHKLTDAEDAAGTDPF